MNSAQIWDVDRIVAVRILAAIGVEASKENVEAIAPHAAAHRLDSAYWAAKRVQIANLERLAEQLRSDYRAHETAWYDGFQEAEACVATTTADEALGVATTTPQTVAEIVRSQIRRAKVKKALYLERS
ncbi:hypothetical protein [Novosphingobium mathurense]|uniref:hypothetical protein n=1 Tax=Novosphingobium mathurense TaxID=428990 RepID=UPI0009A6F896|nr:hypothetical protein [Novosphingobium mathurense]